MGITRTRKRTTGRFSEMCDVFLYHALLVTNPSIFQFKAQYDLINQAVPGPSRTTRRAQTERRQTLTAPSIAMLPLPTTSAPKTKIKTKTNTAIWESLAATRRKGKEEMEKDKLVKGKEKEKEKEKEEEMVAKEEEMVAKEKEKETEVEVEVVVATIEKENEQDHEQEEEKDREEEMGEEKVEYTPVSEKSKMEVETFPGDNLHPADGDSGMLMEPDGIRGATEDPAPVVSVRTNGEQNVKASGIASISSSMETRKRKAPMSNGHIGESISVSSRRSSRFKVPGEDQPKESVRRVTRQFSVAGFPFVYSMYAKC
jgi:hypothetical protein